MSLGIAVVSPYPDLVSFSMLLGLAQVVNIKPYERDGENDPSSNATASLLCVRAANEFLVPDDALDRILQGAHAHAHQLVVKQPPAQ